jgi:uncharacterized membrane protein YjjB (DUF3815 family)
VAIAYSAYSAAVAARIGGGALEMLVAAVIGLAAGGIHFGTLHHAPIDLQKSFLAGLFGGLIGLLLSLVLPPFALPHALFGGITLLVPAMVLTIGVHELAHGSLESGILRLAYGLLRFAMLAAGIAAGATIWKLAAPLPPEVTPVALPEPLVLGIVTLGGFALVGCLQARLRDAPVIAASALLAYGVQALTKLVVVEHGAPLVCAFAVGVAAQLYTRITKQPNAVVVVPGLLQLAPGFMGTEAVIRLLGGGGSGSESFFHVMLVALQLVLGLLAASIVFGRREWGVAEE